MDDHDHHSGRYAELQQHWHGWGAPVGAGIALLSLGGFLLLLAQPWSRRSCDDRCSVLMPWTWTRWSPEGDPNATARPQGDHDEPARLR